MKKPKSNREEVRANTFTVCCLEKEKKNIERAAREKGLSISAFVRLVVNEYLREKERRW